MATNLIILEGFLGNDLEFRKLPDGKELATFNLGVSRNYKDAEGNYPTDWFRCTVSDERKFDFLEKRLFKGTYVSNLTGRLQVTQKDGKSYVDVRVETISLMPERSNGRSQTATSGRTSQASNNSRNQQTCRQQQQQQSTRQTNRDRAPARQQSQEQFDDFDDELPPF